MEFLLAILRFLLGWRPGIVKAVRPVPVPGSGARSGLVDRSGDRFLVLPVLGWVKVDPYFSRRAGDTPSGGTRGGSQTPDHLGGDESAGAGALRGD
jgi:hypothetical protein